jgi:glucokinase
MTLRGVRSTILDLANGNIEAITSDLIDKANAAGDAIAREILLETVDFLSLWLGNIVDLLEPDVMIMGGGVATMLGPFFDEVRNRMPQYCVNTRCHEIPLLKAHYGADSGILGAASIVSVEKKNGVRTA